MSTRVHSQHQVLVECGKDVRTLVANGKPLTSTSDAVRIPRVAAHLRQELHRPESFSQQHLRTGVVNRSV